MIFFHNAHSYTHFSYLYTKYNTSRQMKRIKTAILLATAAVAVTACNRKPVVPEFGMLPIDTLLGTQDNGCNIEYRFATIGNAGKSAALEVTVFSFVVNFKAVSVMFYNCDLKSPCFQLWD